MKVQVRILKQVLNIRMVLLFGLGLLFSLFYILNHFYLARYSFFDSNQFQIALGLIDLKKIDGLSILICLFHALSTIYFGYKYYTYELRDSFFNILLRINVQKWIVSKILTSLIVVIGIRLGIFFVLYGLVSPAIALNSIPIWLYLGVHILLLLILITIRNFKLYSLIALGCLFPLLIFGSKCSVNFLLFGTILFLLLYNVLFFNLKRFIHE